MSQSIWPNTTNYDCSIGKVRQFRRFRILSGWGWLKVTTTKVHRDRGTIGDGIMDCKYREPIEGYKIYYILSFLNLAMVHYLGYEP